MRWLMYLYLSLLPIWANRLQIRVTMLYKFALGYPDILQRFAALAKLS